MLCVVALIAAAMPSIASAQAPDARAVDPAAQNPLEGLPLYVERGDHPAWRQFRFYLKRGRRHRAELMRPIVERPKFHWFGRWTRMGELRRWLGQAARSAPGNVPLMAVMRHQGRRCGGGYPR